MRRLVMLTALLCGCSCASVAPQRERPLNPERYAGLLAFDTPWLYQQWFRHVEQCSGLTADISLLHFYVAPKPILTLAGRPGLYAGLYYHDDHTIILGLYETADSVVVSHELLHFVLREHNKSSDEDMHPREWFVVKCGAVVGPLNGA